MGIKIVGHIDLDAVPKGVDNKRPFKYEPGSSKCESCGEVKHTSECGNGCDL